MKFKVGTNLIGHYPVQPEKFRIVLVLWVLFTISLFSGINMPSYPKRSLEPQCFFQLNSYWARVYLLSLKFPVHLVKTGETLRSIARDYYVTPELLLSFNQIENEEPLEAGIKLFIPPVNSNRRWLRWYRVSSGETVKGLLQQWGINEWELQRLNPNVDLKAVTLGSSLLIPGQRNLSSRGGGRRLRLLKPVSAIVSSRYGKRWGRMHLGIDLAASYGTAVKAAADGRVIFAGRRGGYGLLVILQHGPFRTYYGHMSRIDVQLDELVPQGETVGLVGATGHATGSHLHFELEVLKKKINPSRFFY